MPQEIYLSPVEWQLLRALSTGASNKRIANEQDKSEFTVRNQLSVLFKKIAVANRTQAVFWYRDYKDVTEMRLIGTSVPLLKQFPKQRMNSEYRLLNDQSVPDD